MADQLSLIIYKNGIFFMNGPFRPYTSASARAFIKDLLDNSFPHELVSQFPSGGFKFILYAL